MSCYKDGGCGIYEMYSCYECPASKPEYLKRKSREPQRLQAIGNLHDVAKQFLIKGNHDRCNNNKFLREFVKVTEYLEVKDSGRTVILCHYPIPCFKNHFYGSFHLYGHVHNSFEWNMMEHDKYLMEELYTTPCQMFNVGAMMPWMDYTPRTLDEIIAANSHNEAVRNK